MSERGRRRVTEMPEPPHEVLEWTCAKCGERVTDPEVAVLNRGYYWHRPCYNPREFPASGKLLPNTLNPFASDPLDGRVREVEW